MTRPLLLIAALVAAPIVAQHSVTAAKPAKPGGSSTITDLGTLGGTHSDAFGINNDAVVVQVVGWSHTASNATHAFVWTAPGPMIDLGTLGGTFSQAYDGNNHSQVAGVSTDALGQRWAAVWTNTGGAWGIERLATLTGACCGNGLGINNGTVGDPAAVAVVGNSITSSGQHHAVVWTKSATGWAVQDLGTLPGDTGSVAHDVNDHAEIVGESSSATGVTSGFLWTAATGMFRLSSLGGDTFALAIGNNGDVAGVSTTAFGDSHAVRWRSATNWSIEDLGTLGGCCSVGFGINSFGDVVGFSGQRAFLANSSGMSNLGARRGQSWARDVNDFKVAVGGSGSGSLHAVLWRLP